MAENDNQEAEPAKKSSGKGMIILVAVLTVVLIGGGGAAAWFFLMNKPAEETAAAESDKLLPPQYVPLEPFVINIKGNGRPRFMQIKLALMTRDPNTVKAVGAYTPSIRNEVVDYLTQLEIKQIIAKKATEQIRINTLTRINNLLTAEQTGVQLDDLLITDMVVQ